MAVITVSRQLGSCGNEIAHQVAERLGYRIVWREIINQCAIRVGSPEVALAMIDELNLLGLKPPLEACQAYLDAVKTAMSELAKEGNVVIVGRGGQIILSSHPDTLHVRLVAPVDVRVKRLAERQNITMKAAHAQIEASDRYHQLYFKRFYRTRWDGPGLYDLVINTAGFSIEATSDLICSALSKFCKTPPNPSLAGA